MCCARANMEGATLAAALQGLPVAIPTRFLPKQVQESLLLAGLPHHQWLRWLMLGLVSPWLQRRMPAQMSKMPLQLVELKARLLSMLSTPYSQSARGQTNATRGW